MSDDIKINEIKKLLELQNDTTNKTISAVSDLEKTLIDEQTSNKIIDALITIQTTVLAQKALINEIKKTLDKI